MISGAPPSMKMKTVFVEVLPDGRMCRKHAAAYLGLAPKTLACWASDKKGPAITHVGGRAFYFKDQLDEFIAKGGLNESATK